MYCGPGSGPMLAAAAAWDGVAVELGLAATGYASVIAELTGAPWVGAASLSMVAAATPYVAWLSQAAARAEQAGMQAAAAAAAYEAAFVMTVPPPVITANRVLVMTLIATNFFGQNSAAIAVAEAQYAEMWAQDAVAMYGYAAASASASRLIPFAAPPKTTNSAGVVADGAVGLRHVVAGSLHLLPVGVGLLVDHLEVTAQLGDELLASHRTGAAPKVTRGQHITNDGLMLRLQRRGLSADHGAMSVDITELIVDGHRTCSP